MSRAAEGISKFSFNLSTICIYMYERGDLVLVTGASCDGKSYQDYQFMIARVEEVGYKDLFVLPIKDSLTYLTKPFRVSQLTCQKINLANVSTHASVTKANIGDLVFIYQENYKEKIRDVGILMTVISSPGQALKAEVMCGEKRHVILYENLMVLEKKCKT